MPRSDPGTYNGHQRKYYLYNGHQGATHNDKFLLVPTQGGFPRQDDTQNRLQNMIAACAYPQQVILLLKTHRTQHRHLKKQSPHDDLSILPRDLVPRTHALHTCSIMNTTNNKSRMRGSSRSYKKNASRPRRTRISRHRGLSVRDCTSVLKTYVRSPVSSSRAIFRYGSLDVRSFLST